MNKLKLRVFLSSPGDVGDERRMALRVMERLQGEFAAVLALEPIVWEHEPVRATSTFQQQIPEPAKADVLVCILWSRLGTRLPGDFRRDDGTVYDSGTAFELETALAAFQNKGHPDILVYRKTAPPLFDVSNREERLLRSEQWDQLSDYLKRWFFNPDGSFKAGFSQFSRLDEFEDMLEKHLRKLFEERLREENIQVGAPGQQLPTWLKGSPFRGLAAFDTEHAEIFHGRTRAIAEAKDRLTRRAQPSTREDGQQEPGTAFLLVTGMSGTGKSSLVRAGLIPAVTTPGSVEGIGLWRWVSFRPAEASDPLLALCGKLYGKGALPELAQGDFTPESLADLLGRMPPQGVAPIRRALERAADQLMQQEKLTRPPQARLLVLVDQLEELFTDERFDADTRQRFAAALDALAHSGVVWVVATLRSDFYHRLQELPVLSRLKDGNGTYDLLPPQGPEIAQMIRNPARAAGLSFEESASQGGLDDVLQQAAARNPGSLPLLSFVLDELYDACKETRRLSFAAYEGLGGLEGAIAKRADDVVRALPAEVQNALPGLLRALITLDRDEGVATARTVLKRLAVHGPAAEALVKAMIDARLLITGGEGEDTVLRVAHEALLTRWPRARQIIVDNREFLQARARVSGDAERWLAEGRSADLLLPSGKRLVEARETLLERRDELDPELIEYVEASLAAEAAREKAKADEARRKLRRTQMAAVVGIILAALAGVGAYFGISGQQEAEKQAAYALEQQKEAEKQAAFAQEQQGVAEREAEAARKAEDKATAALAEAERTLQQVLTFQSKTLALESRRQTAAGDAILGELLALEALPKPGDTRPRPYVDEAESALKVAIAAQNGLVTYSHYESVNDVDVSPDGKHLVTGSNDRTARIWDLVSGMPLLTLKGHSDGLVDVNYSPDGSLVATAAYDGKAMVFDAATGEAKFTLNGHEGTVWEATFSPDGRRLATYGDDKTVRVWDLSNGTQIAVMDGSTDILGHIEWSPDNATLAIASFDGYLYLWDPVTNRILQTIGGDFTKGIEWAAWSPDGSQIVFGDGTGSAEIYNTADGSFVHGLYGRSKSRISRVAWSPDGDSIVTGDLDGGVYLWDAHSGNFQMELEGHRCDIDEQGQNACAIWQLEFSKDSRYLATLGRDKTVRLWDVWSREALTVLRQDGAIISSVDFSDDADRVVTGAWDGTARLWAVSSGPAKAVMGRRAKWMTEVAYSPDGKTLAIGTGNEGILELHSVEDGSWIDTLPFHINELTRLAFSKDGKRLLSASYDYGVAIWKLDARETEDVPPYAQAVIWHDAEVLWADFSPDDKLIASSAMDGSVKISDAETGALVHDLSGHTQRVNSVRWSPDGTKLVTASDDNLAIIWDVASGKALFTLKQHTSWVNYAEFSADGTAVITASDDGSVALWDVATGKNLGVVQVFDYGAWHATFSPDGKRLAVAGKDGGALYDLDSGKEVARLPHEFEARYVEFSPDGQRVATFDQGGHGVVWSAKDGKEIARLDGHTAPIYAATWAPRGESVATVSEDGTAGVWNPLSGERLLTIENERDEFWDVSFSPDGKWVIGGGYVNLQVWDAESGRREWLLTGHREHIVRAIFSPDGQRLITASTDGTAILRETDKFSEVSTISHYSPVYDAQFSADSQRLVTVDQSGQVAVWDGKTADLISLLKGHTDRVNSGRFDPVDNTRLVTGSDDNTAIVWDTTTGQPLLTLRGHTGWVNEALYTPDGKTIATMSADGTAKLWDANTGELLRSFEGHLKEVWDGAISPDGRLLATASGDGTARVWEIATGKELFILPVPSATVNKIAFSPEGDHIVTVSNDKIARLWDAKTGILVSTLEGHSDSILDAEFSPDGRALVTGGRDGRARLWRVFTGANLVSMARTEVPRQLTDAEREKFIPPLQ
jgi:WD40 repeat protein